MNDNELKLKNNLKEARTEKKTISNTTGGNGGRIKEHDQLD